MVLLIWILNKRQIIHFILHWQLLLPLTGEIQNSAKDVFRIPIKNLNDNFSAWIKYSSQELWFQSDKYTSITFPFCKATGAMFLIQELLLLQQLFKPLSRHIKVLTITKISSEDLKACEKLQNDIENIFNILDSNEVRMYWNYMRNKDSIF